MFFKRLQSEKACAPIDMTLDGIVMDFKLEHSENPKSLIDVTLDGMLYIELGWPDG